ncbi:MAG: hypothetical protein C0601_06250 [Candidatus Muiribacterium halophilum]|uniref:O-antigen ligase-related domain-containing protein n=1 Tax=Muiribacterium halophilum TaxID=2053465 RepID=A0A2N5ZGM6_MUIH1|nr:MAG: hypothetical protein C0601_06250 [Candidatus Muirbacterium halophilum]
MAFYLLVLIFFIGFLPSPDISGSWMLTRALISLLLIPIFFYKKIRLPSADKFKYIIFFLAFISFRSLFTLNRYLAIENVVWYIVLFFVYIVFLNSFRKRDWKYILYYSSFVAILAILSRLNITDYLISYIKNGMIIKERSWNEAVDLWFFNSNYLCALFLFSSLRGFLLSSKVKKINIYLALNLIGIIICGGESALIAYIFCYLAGYFHKKRKIIYIAAFSCVVLIFLLIILSYDNSATLMHRKLFFSNALLQFLDNPFFGSGPGHFVIFFNRYLDASLLDIKLTHLPPSIYVHNDILQILCENGVFGVLFLLIGLFYIFRDIRSPFSLFFLSLLMFSTMNHAIYFERGMLTFIIMLSTLSIKKKKMNNFIVLKMFIFCVICISFMIAATNLLFAYSKDINLLENALIIRPGNYYGMVDLASLYNNKKEYKKALLLYENAKKINPYNPFLYKNLSIVRLNLGQKEKALMDIRDEFQYSIPKNRFDIALKGISYSLRFKDGDMVKNFIDLAIESAENENEKKKITEILKKIEKQ